MQPVLASRCAVLGLPLHLRRHAYRSSGKPSAKWVHTAVVVLVDLATQSNQQLQHHATRQPVSSIESVKADSSVSSVRYRSATILSIMADREQCRNCLQPLIISQDLHPITCGAQDTEPLIIGYVYDRFWRCEGGHFLCRPCVLRQHCPACPSLQHYGDATCVTPSGSACTHVPPFGVLST